MKPKRLTDKLTFKQTPIQGKACGLYIRVSSDEFATNANGEKERRESVQAQIQDAIAWAKAQGFNETIIYDNDCDISGHEDAINRPAITRIIKDIEAGKLHHVYCREQSRFVRNSKLWQIMVWDYFYPYGVNFKDAEGTDITTETGLMLAGIKAGQNQAFLVETARKSMRSKMLAAEKGTLRICPPFGYGVQEIDGIRKGYVKPDEAELIKEAFDRAANGEGTVSILKDFVNRGIRSKNGANPLHVQNIHRYLKNPIYKGVLFLNGKEYKSPYPAIVSHELWEKVQDERGMRAGKYGADRRAASNSHLLTGLLKCGYCCDKLESGKEWKYNIHPNMVLTHTQKREDSTGKEKRYQRYFCQTKRKNGAKYCPDSISLMKRNIEEEVARWVSAMIANDYAGKAEKGGNRLGHIAKAIETITATMQKIKKAKGSIIALQASGTYDEETTATAIAANKAAMEKAENELRALNGERDAIIGKGTKEALNGLRNWDSLSMDERKAGLHKLFSSIKVYDGKIVISYKANPNETVTLPLRYGQHIGWIVDHEKAEKELKAYPFKLSAARI